MLSNSKCHATDTVSSRIVAAVHECRKIKFREKEKALGSCPCLRVFHGHSTILNHCTELRWAENYKFPLPPDITQLMLRRQRKETMVKHMASLCQSRTITNMRRQTCKERKKNASYHHVQVCRHKRKCKQWYPHPASSSAQGKPGRMSRARLSTETRAESACCSAATTGHPRSRVVADIEPSADSTITCASSHCPHEHFYKLGESGLPVFGWKRHL